MEHVRIAGEIALKPQTTGTLSQFSQWFSLFQRSRLARWAPGWSSKGRILNVVQCRRVSSPKEAARRVAVGHPRDTGSYTTLLIIEVVVGLVVVLSNLVVFAILIAGWRRLIKHHFYIIVSNLVVFTSLKAVVEMGFIVPYYVMKGDEEKSAKKPFGYFSSSYELFIFHLSVFADYGVLFFSVVIAVNRYLSVAKTVGTREAKSSVLKTAVSCISAWVASALIPLLFYLKIYYNQCEIDIPWIRTLIDCLIYLTYACAIVVILLYLLIFFFLRRERRKRSALATPANRSSAEMKLLRQSLFIFILYVASMMSVFILSFVNPGNQGMFDIAYAENLLNLLIAAIYPICFVAMSGEMKSILISRLAQASVSGRVATTNVASISLNNNAAYR